MKHLQARVQYRYYETPPNCHVLALLGAGWIREYGNDLDALHFHNHLELGYCRNGEGTMTFGDRKTPYTTGMFSVVPPYHLHHTNSLPGEKCHWEFLFVNVESVLAQLIPDNSLARTQLARKINQEAALLKHEEHPQIANMILAIMDEHRNKADRYLESISGMLQSLLITISRLCDDDPADTGAGKCIEAIAPGIDYVAQHYREKISVSMLAAACHMSETHFRRLFLQSMRISPLTYINRIRVEAVCKLLHSTNEAIGHIAVKCGFITITALNRNFKEITGMSPSQWRKDTQYYERKLHDSKIQPYEGWR
ncbi:MAG: AraC family transcriptional regulator [Oscillospiraceae bacterium]|nr:AraC family transcriptional regulator [Oscillospiraceae bacterium]